MPRLPRQLGSSGIYHIMLRGANRQQIFHDGKDNLRFLDTLQKYKQENELKIYAWCLMGNHAHLLLQEGNEELAVTMKRIGVSYVSYYNMKYAKTGHLFHDRYRSENIDNDTRLLAVIRYIHHNPVEAGLVDEPQDWKWSSCREYYNEPINLSLSDRDFILKMFAGERRQAIEAFVKFNEMPVIDDCLDEQIKLKLTDEEAIAKINELFLGDNIAIIKTLPKRQRDEMVRKIKRIQGINQRQISRLTGISLSLISRA